MVARILVDRRYTGIEEFPTILDEEIYQQAARKRTAKQKPIQQTEAQKVLRQLCRQRVCKTVENQVLTLLNTLIQSPDLIQQPLESAGPQGVAAGLERELETLLENQPIDEDAARDLVRQIAAAQYAAIPNEEYETLRLRRVFSQAGPLAELDTALLKSTLSHIQLTYGGITSIQLKNGQIIERRPGP